MVQKILAKTMTSRETCSWDITQLFDDPELRRTEFPITASKNFLAHAATSPLPRPVSEAITNYAHRASTEGQWEYIYHHTEDETRHLAAGLLGAQPEEIALVSSTTAGLNMIASSFPWQVGDNVIIADGDFPANIYPWLNQQSRGVEVRFVPRNQDGSVTLKTLEPLVDSHTRLVSLSSVNYVSGFRVDISSIGSFLKQKDILFCVDGIQSFGALPTDLKYVDFFAAGSNKWLLGPLGTGILYVKQEHQEKLNPSWVGWKTSHKDGAYTTYDFKFPKSARKFEPFPIGITGLQGLNAALKLLSSITIPKIASRLIHFRTRLYKSLVDKGYHVLGDLDSQSSSGITSFTSNNSGIHKLRIQLDNAHIVVSIREGLKGGQYIRVAPHFYNTEEEIDQFLELVPCVDR